MNYKEKLKDPRWQRKRLEVMYRDDFKCTYCSDSKSTLNVHHLSYGQNPWDTCNEDLMTLCESCHYVTEQCKKMFSDGRIIVEIVKYDGVPLVVFIKGSERIVTFYMDKYKAFLSMDIKTVNFLKCKLNG